MSSFAVKITGFASWKRAKDFLDWYEGGGEQQFWDHLDIIGEDPHVGGCNIDVHTKYIFHEETKTIEAKVK